MEGKAKVQIYDSLAAVYDAWASADRAAVGTLEYYTALCKDYKGPAVVELGVGTGRIAVNIALKWGQAVVGFDCSREMLRLCAARARANNVEHLVNTRLSDIRFFKLDEPASLIIMPFRTFGHFVTDEERMVVLQSVRSQLDAGGEFVFDHYIINEEWARTHDRIQRLVCRIATEDGGCTYVWDTYEYDFTESRMHCTVSMEKIDGSGRMEYRKHQSFSFSWISPEDVRTLLDVVGFEVVEVLGGFEGQKLDTTSQDQIWRVRLPR